MKKLYIFTSLTIIIITIMSFMTTTTAKYINKPLTEFGVISSTLFNTWIGGAPNAVDVFVKPANSVDFVGDNVAEDAFDHDKRQDFFRWSEQMFLWILSPVPTNGSYGTCGGLVLNSPEFYDFDTANQTYVKHKCNGLNKMTFDVLGAQNGPHNLPLFIEEGTGKVYDVDKAPKSINGLPLVYDRNKNKVEVAKVVVTKNVPVFYDKNSQVIDKVSLILKPGLNPRTTIQQFQSLDASVAVLIAGDAEPIVLNPTIQQASLPNGDSANVLMSRSNNSLVYYNIMVNDVYVAFSKMVGEDPNHTNDLFPTTSVEFDRICRSFTGRIRNDRV